MGDDRPIGIFDSGVGGLTVLQALQTCLPGESTIYLGDLARCPYGTRPQPEVALFALQIADFLAESGVKLLVVACNTATAAAFARLRDRYPFPVLGVIEPGAREAARVSRRRRVGVVATDGTVASGAYPAAIHAAGPDIHVVQRSASWLVPMIEWGPVARTMVAEGLRALLADFRSQDVDLLLLGCTHFPLVRDIFEEEAGPDITVLDSAVTTADAVASTLDLLGLHAQAPPHHRVLVTGPAEAFVHRTCAMFCSAPSIETVDLALPSC